MAGNLLTKRLINGTASTGTIYTVPAGKKFILNYVSAANTDGVSNTWTLLVNGIPIQRKAIATNAHHEWRPWHVLEAGDVLTQTASNAGGMWVHITGTEIQDGTKPLPGTLWVPKRLVLQTVTATGDLPMPYTAAADRQAIVKEYTHTSSEGSSVFIRFRVGSAPVPWWPISCPANSSLNNKGPIIVGPTEAMTGNIDTGTPALHTWYVSGLEGPA